MKHPITGIEHQPAEVGWKPPVRSFVMGPDASTCPVFGLDDEMMKAQAEGLSQITGKDIQWKSSRGIGSFTVKNFLR